MREVTDEQLQRWVEEANNGCSFSWQWPTHAECILLLAAAREREAGLVGQLLEEAKGHRRAIRHALQFLRDPQHRGDGHLAECIADCEARLETDVKFDPSAALEQLRARERSIGAEEKVRQIAEEECSTVFPDDLPHITQNQLLDIAAAIAAERDHFPDVGKKVEGEGE